MRGPVHDPFDKPVFDLPFADELGKRLEDFIPKEQHREHLMLATPATKRRDVLGAQPLARCQLCQQQVWISPSSRPYLETSCFVCSSCAAQRAPAEFLAFVLTASHRARALLRTPEANVHSEDA